MATTLSSGFKFASSCQQLLGFRARDERFKYFEFFLDMEFIGDLPGQRHGYK